MEITEIIKLIGNLTEISHYSSSHCQVGRFGQAVGLGSLGFCDAFWLFQCADLGRGNLDRGSEPPALPEVHDSRPLSRFPLLQAATLFTVRLVHTATSMIIHAPKERIFETAADLALWPSILPHYRYIRFYEKSPTRSVVKMAAVRSGIPIAWTSEQIVDREACEVRFTHLKAWTKGMEVVWTFRETPAGVLVEIVHDLRFRWRLFAPVAERIIGDFFIQNIANKTLRRMKEYLEHEP